MRNIMWGIMGSVTLLGAWAYVAEIDQSTRASGQVIASSRSQTIQTPDGGILEKLMVKEGTTVEKGQLLAVLDQTRTEAAFRETEAKKIALEADLIRLKAEVLDREPVFGAEFNRYPDLVSAQLTLFRKRQQAIKGDISALEDTLKLVKEELNLNLPLLDRGDVSKVEVLKLKRQVADINFQIQTRKGTYFKDAQAELAKAEAELNAVKQTLAQRKDALEHTHLYAPVKGIVKNVKHTTIGASLKSADTLMEIVPLDDDLLIEVKIHPKDIAQLKPGLPATIKIDAYDYSIYGSLSGKLVYISPDTIEDDRRRKDDEPYYRAQVKADGRQFQNGKNAKQQEIDIQPGMTATVELITGSNTVMKYLTKPIIKTLDEAMTER